MFVLPALAAASVLLAPALSQPAGTGGKQPPDKAAPSDASQTVTLRLIPSGAAKRLGYVPLHAPLSDKQPASIKKLPDGLQSPRFAKLPILGRKAGTVYFIILDEPEGKPPRFFADTNGDGDLTNDPPAQWQKTREPEGDKPALYEGGAPFEAGAGTPAMRIAFFSTGQRQPEISFYRDYAVAGRVMLAGQPYDVALSDDSCRLDFTSAGTNPRDAAAPAVQLLIDADGDGNFGGPGESFDARKPFDFAASRYGISDISRDGMSFTLKKIGQALPTARPPADPPAKEPAPKEPAAKLPPTAKEPAPKKAADQPKIGKEVGQRAFPFEDTTMDKKPVKFPADYKGKVVLLDFWATWCPPCMAEVPNLAAAYKKFHADGFEILGITLDNKNAEDRIRSVTKDKGMDWVQVYDGGGWKARLAKMYEINSIPNAFLVDGDTGVILASGNSLRGPGLEAAITRELQKRRKSN